MSKSKSNDATRGSGCSGCGAPLGAGQRYCVACGARRGPLPAMVARRIEAVRRRRGGTDVGAAVAAVPAAEQSSSPPPEREPTGYWRFMPSPQVAAVAVMALLAAGVVLGSVTSPLASSAGLMPIVLEMSGGEEGGREEAIATPTERPSAPPQPLVVAASAPEAFAAPVAPPVVEPEPTPPPIQLPPELPEEPVLPPVSHVFLIVLEGHGYEEAFGETSTTPYLAQALAAEGELLPNYYAVTQGSLANRIALLSGQGPTPETALDCPEYAPIVPGEVSDEGQVEGSGCAYPEETPTLPGQLAEGDETWKAYVEDPADGCGSTTTGNPLAYFPALTAGPECPRQVVGLDRLEADLRTASRTPALSYLVPAACHRGGEVPCGPEQPTGLAASSSWLETIVPKITSSPAYEEGGLIAITFDQAPQEGPGADASSCCATPEYPNLPPPPTPPELTTGPVKPSGGGGRVGLLLLSPFVAPGSVEASGYYNHFSLLRGIEELLGLPPLGYAADEALAGFGPEVFDAETSTSPTASPPGVTRSALRHSPVPAPDSAPRSR